VRNAAPRACISGRSGAAAQSNKGSTSIVSAWNTTKATTEQTMKLLQGYKDAGDSNKEVSCRAGLAQQRAAGSMEGGAAAPVRA
jgi:hypothetical protein